MNTVVLKSFNDRLKIATVSALMAGTFLCVPFTVYAESPSVSGIEQTVRNITVKGVVVDAGGEPVIGASVQLKGAAGVGTITDVDGKFTLSVPANGVLQISYIGYKTTEVRVNGQAGLKVTLQEDTETLDEVVVVGYGIQKKASVTGSVAAISSDKLMEVKAPSVTNMLAGRLPGLRAVQRSGSPGDDGASVDIRGYGSMLVIVDGIERDYTQLDPNDIESISILKDAAAAVYGFKGSNGVLLVTTKKGTEQKVKIEYNGYVGFQKVTRYPEMMNAYEYASLYNEAIHNANPWRGASAYSQEQLEAYRNGTAGTDWWSETMRSTAPQTSHNLSLTGGTEKVKYLVSAGVDHQTGIFPQTQQNVFNVRSSTDIRISKKFDISFDIRYQLRDMEGLNDQQDIYKQVIAADPTMVAYYTDGTYGYNAGFFTNPLVALYEGGQKFTNRHEASGLFKLNYEIIDGLTFTGIANVKYTFKGEDSQSRKLVYKNYFTQELIEKGQNSYSDRRDQNNYYNLQALLNYKKSFGIHNFDILVGYQQESESSDWLKGSRSGYPTDLIWELNPGPKDNWSNDGNGEHWALASFIGRINYDYDNKYILSLSMRSDASSRFAVGSRWSTFPSVAAAWRLSQESFMEGTRSFLDDLKIRASWGQTGNANGLGLYPSYTLVSTGGLILNNSYQQIAQLKTIGNTELTWEHSDMFNIGLDARLLNSRLSFTGEYYVKNTRDILLAMPVPLEYGFGKPNVNIGQVRNKGWELSLGWSDRVNDFGYSISANLSDNRSKVVDLGDTGPWKGSNTYTEVGLPFNSIYGYESMGLFQSDKEVADAPFQNSKTAHHQNKRCNYNSVCYK